MTDVKVSSVPAKNSQGEEREEIIIVTDETVRSGDEVVKPASEVTPQKEKDDDIDVTTVSNSPNGMISSSAKTALEERRFPTKTTPSAMNLDNFIREERMIAMRKMQSHPEGAKDYRQAIDHDYVNMNRLSGSANRFNSGVYRSPAQAASQSSANGNSGAANVPAAPAVPVSPSAIHRRKRKGASVDHNANSDSDDPEEELFRSAKIEYTKAYDPTNEDDFSCPRCPAQFESRVGLTNHLKLHGSQKKFPCTLCDFCCTNKKTMRQHRRIHGIYRHIPAKRIFLAKMGDNGDDDSDIADTSLDEAKAAGLSLSKQQVKAIPPVATAGVAKFAPSSGAKKQAVTTPKSTAKALNVRPEGRPQRTPAKARPDGGDAMELKSAENTEEMPPPLRAVGVDMTEESQATNQPIIRAIDFALKLNQDDDGNPLPLPQRDATTLNQPFTLVGPSALPSTSLKFPPKTKSVIQDQRAGDGTADDMPMLPLEMENEEASDFEEDSQLVDGNDKEVIGGSSAKGGSVKCKDCPFVASTVSRLQSHLSGHTRENGYKCQFCTFKSGTTELLKRHMSVHDETSFEWPPIYVGDHMDKLRKRLAKERQRKAEAERTGTTSSSKPKNAESDVNDEQDKLSDKSASESSPKQRRGKRGPKGGAKAADTEPEDPSTTQPTRRSTRTSRPPKPVYTSPSYEPSTRARRSAAAASAAAANPPADTKEQPKRAAKNLSVKSPASPSKLAESGEETNPASASSSDAGYNQCNYCDYKVPVRAPSAVMSRHVTRRHKEETSKNA